MKKIAINVISAVLIIMIVATVNRMTIKKTTYEDVYWQGTGYTYATVHKTETRFITGEVLSEEKLQVHWTQGFAEFLTDFDTTRDSMTLGFR